MLVFLLLSLTLLLLLSLVLVIVTVLLTVGLSMLVSFMVVLLCWRVSVAFLGYHSWIQNLDLQYLEPYPRHFQTMNSTRCPLFSSNSAAVPEARSFHHQPWILPPLSNTCRIVILYLIIGHRPCYWVGAVPNRTLNPNPLNPINPNPYKPKS